MTIKIIEGEDKYDRYRLEWHYHVPSDDALILVDKENEHGARLVLRDSSPNTDVLDFIADLNKIVRYLSGQAESVSFQRRKNEALEFILNSILDMPPSVSVESIKANIRNALEAIAQMPYTNEDSE